MIQISKMLPFILIASFFSSCSEENSFQADNQETKMTRSLSNSISSNDEAIRSMQRFSVILSKAVYERQDVRQFLKEQALRKIDTDYNIFYPLVKDLKINGTSFKDILSLYAQSPEELDTIEQRVPLLNIHMPEIGNIKVSSMDVSDNEIPVLFQNKFYSNGEVKDSLTENEIPGFNVFVVYESGTIQPVSESSPKTLKFTNGSDLLGGKYEYVDNAFNPEYYNKKKQTRSGGYENPTPKYDEGLVPKEDLDPLLLKSFENSKTKKTATRAMMYYNLKTPDDTPVSQQDGIKDCIFRFKIAPAEFSVLEDIAEGFGDKPSNVHHPLFNQKNPTVKHKPITRQEALSRILTGYPFKFELGFEDNTIQISALPSDIFNFYINESRRHGTWFRKTKYTYSIDLKNIKDKWYYPLEHGFDTRFNTWDILKDPLTKKVILYAINPDNGASQKTTTSYTTTVVSNKEIGGNISAKIKEIISLGINGKFNQSNTITKTVTNEYTIPQKNLNLGSYIFDYFEDYPVEAESGNYVLLGNRGNGSVNISIVPISNSFFNTTFYNK